MGKVRHINSDWKSALCKLNTTISVPADLGAVEMMLASSGSIYPAWVMVIVGYAVVYSVRAVLDGCEANSCCKEVKRHIQRVNDKCPRPFPLSRQPLP